jgi:hypothetical protein
MKKGRRPLQAAAFHSLSGIYDGLVHVNHAKRSSQIIVRPGSKE